MMHKERTRITTLDKVIGHNLKFYRKRAKISAKELGKHLGVSFQQVQKYEQGLNRVSASRLLEIAELLGVDIRSFYGERKSFVCVHSNSTQEKQASDLNRSFMKINDEHLRKKIIDFVKSLESTKLEKDDSVENNV